MELGDPAIRAPIQQELKIAERFVAYSTSEMDKVTRIDENEEERRKWKAYLRNVRKYRAGLSKASYSKGNNPS